MILSPLQHINKSNKRCAAAVQEGHPPPAQSVCCNGSERGATPSMHCKASQDVPVVQEDVVDDLNHTITVRGVGGEVLEVSVNPSTLVSQVKEYIEVRSPYYLIITAYPHRSTAVVALWQHRQLFTWCILAPPVEQCAWQMPLCCCVYMPNKWSIQVNTFTACMHAGRVACASGGAEAILQERLRPAVEGPRRPCISWDVGAASSTHALHDGPPGHLPHPASPCAAGILQGLCQDVFREEHRDLRQP